MVNTRLLSSPAVEDLDDGVSLLWTGLEQDLDSVGAFPIDTDQRASSEDRDYEISDKLPGDFCLFLL
jgi:hypothetical protein